MQGIQEETVWRAEVVIVSSSPVPPFLHKHLHQ